MLPVPVGGHAVQYSIFNGMHDVSPIGSQVSNEAYVANLSAVVGKYFE